jgi:hypothetical protein
MDVLGLLATTVLTEAQITNQQVLKSLPSQPETSQAFLPLFNQSMTQIIPVYQLEAQFTTAPLTAKPSQLLNQLAPLENRISNLETQQFFPTAILEGEVVFGISGVSGRNFDDSPVFQQSIELKLNVSFTGEDVLEIELESGNLTEFSYVGDRTFEGRLGFLDNTDGRLELSELSYEFPISERASLYLSTNGSDLNDFNPFFDRRDNNALFNFGAENSIHDLVEDAGLQLNYDLTDTLSLSLGYFSGEANDPKAGSGLFNGNQSTFVQLEFEPSDSFLLGLTYIYSYNDSALETGTGSLRAQINLERPVVGHSYGVSASFLPSSKLTIGGWVGLTNATVIDLGTANVWNYALTLALSDIGNEGNLLYAVVGQEPRLTGTSGFRVDGRRRDSDISLHIQLFYSHRLSDYVSVAPGFVWITAPNHDNNNPDMLVFTVKTTFKF